MGKSDRRTKARNRLLEHAQWIKKLVESKTKVYKVSVSIRGWPLFEYQLTTCT